MKDLDVLYINSPTPRTIVFDNLTVIIFQHTQKTITWYIKNHFVLFSSVKNWALKFGVDLWEFGRQYTKMNEIQRVTYLHYILSVVNQLITRLLYLL